MRPLISELTAAEAAKSKAKDYAAAKELENARVSLEGLVSTIETLEANEQELVRAKQYADAEETKAQVEAAQSKLATEEADVRDRLGAWLVIKDDRAVAAAATQQSPSAPSTETTTRALSCSAPPMTTASTSCSRRRMAHSMRRSSRRSWRRHG